MSVSRFFVLFLIALALTIIPAVLPAPGVGTAQAGDILPDGRRGNLTDDQVVVYYFHRKFKCGSCEVIESTLQTAIEARYGSQFKDGRLAMCVVNIDDPSNRAYLDQFELLSTSLVIVQKSKGTVTQYKHLDSVWDVSQDREAITHLLQTELAKYLGES